MKKVAVIGLSGNSLFFQLDNLPKCGETKKANSYYEEVGGKGYNQAIALKRLGLDVVFLSAIGDDADGKKCEDFMKKEGVKSYFIKKKSHTALATIMTSEKADNEVIVYHGAHDELNIFDLNIFKDELLKSDCILLQYEIPYNVLKEVVKFCKEINKLLIINPAPYVYDDLSILQAADIITPNETEACQIAGVNEFDIGNISQIFKEKGIKKFVITLGEKGSYAYDGENYQLIQGEKVKAVDTTGAGDVFNASLVYGLLNNMHLFDACKFANIQASKSVCKKYVMNSIPYLGE